MRGVHERGPKKHRERKTKERVCVYHIHPVYLLRIYNKRDTYHQRHLTSLYYFGNNLTTYGYALVDV